MLEIKIRQGSDTPDMPYAVDVFANGKLDDTTACNDYNEALIYAKGLRDGYRLCANSIRMPKMDYGRQHVM